LSVDLSDGRTISVPLTWFARLLYASPEERNNWRLIGKGQGIHWEDIDEDISIEGLLAGKPSGESQDSFKKWIAVRKATAKKPTKVSASGTVLAIIKRSRKGIGAAALTKKTDLEGRKIRDIIYRLKKQGKIKRDRKGLYVKA
jgi:hypothetical protein